MSIFKSRKEGELLSLLISEDSGRVVDEYLVQLLPGEALLPQHLGHRVLQDVDEAVTAVSFLNKGNQDISQKKEEKNACIFIALTSLCLVCMSCAMSTRSPLPSSLTRWAMWSILWASEGKSMCSPNW